MKKITLLLGCLSLFFTASAQTFSDDFEKDTLGELGLQSAEWRTWSGLGGGAEDVMVVNTDNYTKDGTNSIYFSSTDPQGGPTDCVLPFGTEPHESGHFTFSAWFKVPSDKSAYFNFQGDTTMGKTYTLDCFMDETGAITIQNGQTIILTATHPVNTWFQLKIDANLNTNNWSLSIDGALQGEWKNTINKLFAIDIYPADDLAEYWVDDVSYTFTPYVLPTLNGAAYNIEVPLALAGQTRTLPFTIRNLGATTLNSFDINVSHNGGPAVKESVTGVNIASLETYVVNLSTPFVLKSGVNTFTAVINNANGAGADGDTSDDAISVTNTPVEPAVGKMVVGEEITGTWSQYSPRGTVYMAMMKERYKGYFVGISAHINDIMKDSVYATGMSSIVSTFPRVLIDRAIITDPISTEKGLMLDVVTPPNGLLVNGALYDPATRQLKVSITTTLQADITSEFKVACVLTEDSVRGTTTDYDQVNGYAGGSKGVMGGFELLPNPVPAAQMVYNQVARVISPSFDGLNEAYSPTLSKGQIITHNFLYTLPPTWNVDQIHIIGLMIDGIGMIDNASTATVKEAITNGYIPGIFVGINKIAMSPDAIQLVPNPATDNTVISLNLKQESAVTVDIYSSTGAIVASKTYGKISGAYHLPIETQQLAKGIYLVKVNINNQPSVLKLIKE